MATPEKYVVPTCDIRANNGSILAVGMFEADARSLAHRVANTLHESVWVTAGTDEDGGEEIAPETK